MFNGDIFNAMLETMNALKNNKPKISPTYLSIRQTGINLIKIFCNKLSLNEYIYHNSVLLMDLLYIYYNSTEDINLISFCCLIIVLKFYEKGENFYKTLETLMQNYSNIYPSSLVLYKNYPKTEIKILKTFKYDIIYYSAYDFLIIILSNKHLFSDINFDNFQIKCILQLNKLIEKKFYNKYEPPDIAFAVIFFIRNKYNLEENFEKFSKYFKYNLEDSIKLYQMLKSKIITKNNNTSSGNNLCKINNVNNIINPVLSNLQQDSKNIFNFRRQGTLNIINNINQSELQEEY